MTEEEKKAQAEALAEAKAAEMPDDAPVLTPEPYEYTLTHCDTGEARTYRIKPLCIAQMRLLTQVSKLKIETFEDADFDKMITCVGKLVGESDKDFIENSVNGPKLQELFRIVATLNYAGIPAQKGAQAGKLNGVKA